ncbi:Glycoside hydrolase, partial [Globisporangium splendens]
MAFSQSLREGRTRESALDAALEFFTHSSQWAMASSSLSLQNLFGVEGKVVVITGGGRGIGKMIADGFVQNGAKVYIASRNLTNLTNTAAELNTKGPGKCIFIQADLSTEAACKALAIEIAKHESRVDVLVNNSGNGWGGELENHPDAVWNKLLAINLKAPFFLTVALLPLLDTAANSTDGGARVINIGSIAGLRPQPIASTGYDTSKAALHHMTRVLAAKLARRPNGGHILVNAIAPGLVPSQMSMGLVKVFRKSFEEIAAFGIPLEQYGHAHDTAGLAIFLASRASGWVTGEVVTLDGGTTNATETVMGSKL